MGWHKEKGRIFRLERKNLKKISAVIPAYNEEKRIADVIKKTRKYVDEVLVIDDGSSDKTALVAKKAGARVLSNKKRGGYTAALKRGFKNAVGDLIITLDADGEHNPEEIPDLIKPLLTNRADLVLGEREKIARISERFLNWLTNFNLQINDTGTGFRAIRKDLAMKLDLKARCTCGVLALEANFYGARIAEVPITVNPSEKKRKIAWHHLIQFFLVLNWLLK